MEYTLPPTSSLAGSDILILLSERRRRQTIRSLRESTSPLTAIELAHRIANREFDTPSAEDVQSIHLALHHNHLPRLDEAAVVVYEVKEETIRPGVNFDAIMNFMTNVNDLDLPWSDQ